MKTHHKGFTLIELLVTLSVATVVLTSGVPSFQDLISNNRMTTVANQLVQVLVLARSEAVNRVVMVTMCKSSDGASCTTSGGWEQGWIVFTDLDKNASYDSATETLLRSQEAITGSVSLTATANVENFVSYVGTGRSHVSSGTITVCDDRAGSVGKSVTLSFNGRAQVASGISCS